VAGPTESVVRDPGLALPPPAAAAGVVGWVRQSLFSSPLNAVLTFLALYVLYVALPPAIGMCTFETEISTDAASNAPKSRAFGKLACSSRQAITVRPTTTTAKT